MLEPAFLDTLWTIVMIALLFTAAGLCLVALPWDEREIRQVHQTALSLFAPRDLIPSGAGLRTRRAARR